MDVEGETSADGQDRNAQPHYPDLIDIVREQAEQGPGPDAGTGAPDADGDRDRGQKASTPPTSPGSFIDGVVSPRDLRLQHQREHPELVEDLKVFLGLKPPTTPTQQVEPPPPNALETVELADASQTKLPQTALETVEQADPYHAKPPQPACAAEAMSAHDGQGPGSEPEPQRAGDAPSSVLDCAALAAPVLALAVAGQAGPSRHDRDAADGDLRHGAHTTPCPHGSGDTSVEDKCLECCVYYGVMCCQCTIS